MDRPDSSDSAEIDGLADALRAEAPMPLARDELLGILRRHLARIRLSVCERFERSELTGPGAARVLAAEADAILRAVFSYAIGAIARQGGPTRAPDPDLTLVATGGYGQGLLAPFSDIDLLFLTTEEPAAETRALVEFNLYFLWDLGLKVGHATRSISQCLAEAGADNTIATALLDARRIAGSEQTFERFKAAFAAERERNGVWGFICAKQAERSQRHARFGDSPFIVEPHIKDGRGGLRDLQTLLWMARYAFGVSDFSELTDHPTKFGPLLLAREARQAKRAAEFLWSVRFNIHYIAGRAEERLTFDVQPVVAARMGYTQHGRRNSVERFMRHYFLIAREVTRLTRVLEPALKRAVIGAPAATPVTDQKLLEAGFMLVDGKLLPISAIEFQETPLLVLRIMKIARDRAIELHPMAIRYLIRSERAARTLRGNVEAADLFMDLLCDAEQTGQRRPSGAVWLSMMNETGFLGNFLPDWSRIVGQMQFDSYHIYTVDQHTVEAARVLNALEAGDLADIAPIASSVVGQLQSRRSLYLAVLLHDIAKGRGGDHSEIGAEIALKVGPALGLTSEETEMTSWLVLHHLLLSQTAFSRDIDDPKTILDLADTIQSPERLRLLLVLTVADMRAVNSKVWNNWKATLLREVYTRVAEILEGGLATSERDVRVMRAKKTVSELLEAWPVEDLGKFLSLGYASYWLSFDPEAHVRHARMIRDAEERHATLAIESRALPDRSVSEITIYAGDHPGLFSRLAGGFAAVNASIVDARIHTLANGMALDTFWVQDAAGGPFDQPNRLARLYVMIEQALAGKNTFVAEIARKDESLVGRRTRAIHVPARVVVDNRASNTHTVIEVNGRDRPGLLYDVTAAISQEGLQIASAHITTYGVRAVDVFYVKDVFGLKVDNERRLQRLKAVLLQTLEGSEGCPVSAVLAE